MSARVAVYDAPASAPLVEEISSTDPRGFIESLAVRVSDLIRSRGGSVPYSVIREVTENFIHAGFAEPVVSILDRGETIRFSDQGPGIPDKARAARPGFTTATTAMKDVIRGVGSGLPIVSDFLHVMGGSIAIEDNLSSGSVITLSMAGAGRATSTQASQQVTPSSATDPADIRRADHSTVSDAGSPDSLFDSGISPATQPSDSDLWLSNRQKQVLALVLESGSAGPSLVSKELGVGLSTAYRDLAALEDHGLIASESGKRTITPAGVAYLSSCSSSSDH